MSDNRIYEGGFFPGGSNLDKDAVKTSKEIIYKSQVMNQLMRTVHRVASSEATILILGESGTGKELVAKAIHDNSARKDKPFVVINCGALRETLLESELFGHEKGAFTGAYTRKIGLAELANGGTLFLDEIGEISHGIQVKFLRFLQEGEIFRVGGKTPIKVNIRLISATNRDLEKDVERGHFREDLFYRLNTIMLQVPPLRRRKEDIIPLMEHFLRMREDGLISREIGLTQDSQVMEALQKYNWPGNIRELQNLCERLKVLVDKDYIQMSDLPEQVQTPNNQPISLLRDYDPSIPLTELEKEYILKALQYFKGNKTQAANALGITIKTLYNKLHEYGEFERFSVHGRSSATNK